MKENLFWRDEKGQAYYFDYEVDVPQTPSPEKVSQKNNTSAGDERSGKGVSEATPEEKPFDPEEFFEHPEEDGMGFY